MPNSLGEKKLQRWKAMDLHVMWHSQPTFPTSICASSGLQLQQMRWSSNDCLIFAIAKACEITARIVHFLSGSNRNVQSLDPYSLRQNLINARLADGVETQAICLFDDEAKDTMLELLESAGIKEANGGHIYRMKNERISKDFETVAMTLADGYPLLVDFILGSNFGDMGYRRVYKGPYSSQKTLPEIVVSHSVVLVGAARSGIWTSITS